MKKIIAVVIAVALFATMLVGCNKAIGFGNFAFDKIHVDTHHYSGCLAVDKWHDNASGIEVKTEKFGSIFLSEGTYMLIEGECPFCAE